MKVKMWGVRLGLTILTLFTVCFSGCLWQEKTDIDEGCPTCPVDGEVFNTSAASSAMVANDIPISDGFDPPVKPIDGKPWWLAQDFCVYNSKFRGYHLGEDWNWGKSNEDLGKPVYAVSNGKVRWAGNAGASWGGVVIIDHALPDGTRVTSMYAHLQNVIPTGTIVNRGDKIGEIGPTPKGSTGPHLHFEIRTDPSIGIGPGYGKSCKGWTDPSTFIDSHRPPLRRVSARIVQYCPPYDANQPLMVYAQQPFTVILTFENTCEIEWDFLARALVQDPSGKTILDVWSSPLKVKPNALADWATWLTIGSSGKYYLEFSVWKDKQTLLDKSPKKIPIQALEPFTVTGTVTHHPSSDCWTIKGDDGHSYYPIDLPGEFKVNGLKVRFKGTKTVGYQGCIVYYIWWCGGEFPIRILEIQKVLELQWVFYSQRDPKWASDPLGTCRTTIGDKGCALTSAAMLLRAAGATDVTPKTLNRWLTENQGYLKGCEIIWKRVADYDGAQGLEWVGTGSLTTPENLKRMLDQGMLVIAFSRRFKQHWVVIRGYEGKGNQWSDFWYWDPYDLTPVKRKVGDGWVRSGAAIRIFKIKT